MICRAVHVGNPPGAKLAVRVLVAALRVLAIYPIDCGAPQSDASCQASFISHAWSLTEFVDTLRYKAHCTRIQWCTASSQSIDYEVAHVEI